MGWFALAPVVQWTLAGIFGLLVIASLLVALLRRLNGERGTTMIVATHDLNLAAALCQRVILLKRGRVLAEGTTAETLTVENIRLLYDVDADVQFHARAGHLTVVPIARAT